MWLAPPLARCLLVLLVVFWKNVTEWQFKVTMHVSVVFHEAERFWWYFMKLSSFDTTQPIVLKLYWADGPHGGPCTYFRGKTKICSCGRYITAHKGYNVLVMKIRYILNRVEQAVQLVEPSEPTSP